MPSIINNLFLGAGTWAKIVKKQKKERKRKKE